MTANSYYHSEYYGGRNNVSHLPFDGYLGKQDTSLLLEKMLSDQSSGIPIPAAIILETVQGEGGVNVASDQWLRRVSELCRRHEILLIIDDIQVGNGRTGKFFSFEQAGITPDLVCLSKSIGGGLPLSIVLIRPECDAWQPGEHTGTFRGNNLAFVAATAVLDHWRSPEFESEIALRGEIVQEQLHHIATRFGPMSFSVRGRGLIWGLDVAQGELATAIIREAFHRGLLIESSGADDEVLKVMPALTIELELLRKGLDILSASVEAAVSKLKTSAIPVFPEIRFTNSPVQA